MKILFSNVGLLDSPKAAFLRTYYFARELADKGHKVTFLTTQMKGYKFPYYKEIRDNIEIIAIPSVAPLKVRKFGYGPISIIIRTIYMLFHDYDIVHSDNHRPSSSFPCFLHSKIKGSKYIAEWWDYFGVTGQYDDKSKIWKLTVGPFDNFLEKFTIKIADGAVVLSKLLKNDATRIRGSKNNIIICWGGSDTKKIQFVESQTIFREKFNLSEKKLIFMATGMGSTEILEYEPFFKALNIVRKRRSDFVFARTGNPVPPRIMQNMNLGDYLVELGFIGYQDYYKVLSCADVFVLIQLDNNKNRGRWPNCVGDYISAGRPIIFNEVGEMNTFAEECSEASLVVKIDNNDSLVEEINQIIDNGRFSLEKCNAIREYSENNFSWKYRVNKLEHFYNKLLKNEKK